MTEVLCAPGNGASYFSPRPPHRSPSNNLDSLDTSSSYHKSPSKHSFKHSEYGSELSISAPSSAPSSPLLAHTTFSREPSYTSTPASSLSLDIKDDSEDEDDTPFPSFEGPGTFSPGDENEQTDSIIAYRDDQPSTKALNHNYSGYLLGASDDQAIEDEPTRHVDYLSHEWKEEDIWSSWRYIVTKRKVYSNSVRLENASWRTWVKAKNNLKTVSPETLNWLKDCDVTWLYGPLQTDNKKPLSSTASPPPSRLSTSSSFLQKKPILKKKSASEAILQRSISAHSLLKQAGDILKAREAIPARPRPSFVRAPSDFCLAAYSQESKLNTPAEECSHSSDSLRHSLASSGLQSPGERRHIHFNNEVSQCIALESKEEDDDEAEDDNRPYQAQSLLIEEEDEDDDGVVMMKQVPSKARISNRSTPRGSFSNESKTIAPLPSTTLKYRGDTPEPAEAQQQRGLNSFWSTGKKLSPSPSQETLRPSRPNANFLIDDDEEDPDLQWQPSSSSYKDHQTPSYKSSTNYDDEYDPGPGMRRTPSGMFMPYDEDEDEAAMNSGLFGRVVDTVNTARDIAHVIWNVGWRR